MSTIFRFRKKSRLELDFSSFRDYLRDRDESISQTIITETDFSKVFYFSNCSEYVYFKIESDDRYNEYLTEYEQRMQKKWKNSRWSWQLCQSEALRVGALFEESQQDNVDEDTSERKSDATSRALVLGQELLEADMRTTVLERRSKVAQGQQPEDRRPSEGLSDPILTSVAHKR